MAHWWIKAAIQKTLGLMPLRHQVNELLQTYVTDSVSLTEQRFHFKLNECRAHLDARKAVCPEVETDFTMFELGPGWFPTLAVGAFLCGAREVWTCDCAPLLKYTRVRSLFERLIRAFDDGVLPSLLPDLIPDRIDRLRTAIAETGPSSAERLLGAIQVNVLVGDARKTGLPASSIDFFASNSVLQHIPRSVLPGILREFARLGRPDAVQSHYIDMADMFSYFDRNIGPLNHLRFSEQTWQWIDNAVVPVNRYRLGQFRSLFRAAEWEPTGETVTARLDEEALARVPLAEEFRACDASDLSAFRAFFTARKAGSYR